ncbi:MAG: hypothetical protein G8237_09945 [Magnetococcales bacterium]|nr:hypothetical protein [Magnetococcales bacterium]NGZ06665.1 hypothetical protein [Magnetococcales bacterium]
MKKYIKIIVVMLASWFSPGTGQMYLGRVGLAFFLSFIYSICSFIMIKISQYGDVRMVFANAFLFHPSESLYFGFVAAQFIRFAITIVSPLHAFFVFRKQAVVQPLGAIKTVATLFILMIPYLVGYFFWRQEAPRLLSNYYDMTIGGVAYRIPKSYVRSISFKSPGVLKHVAIDFSYPDMVPLAKMSAEMLDEPGFGSRIRLLVQDGNDHPNVIDVISNGEKAGMINLNGINYQVDGLQAVLAGKPLWDNADRFILVRNFFPIMFLSCDRQEPKIFPGCNFYANIHHNTRVEGSFGRQYLDEIEFVNQAFIKLFNGFREDATMAVDSNTSISSHTGDSYGKQ